MSADTISIITYREVEPIAAPSEEPGGSKSGASTKGGSWARTLGEPSTENIEPIKWELIRKDVEISTMEKELTKLVTQMNQILKHLGPDGEPAPAAEERKFFLDAISLHVEISAEGSLSVLGTGGKLGGKGGMQLTFARAKT